MWVFWELSDVLSPLLREQRGGGDARRSWAVRRVAGWWGRMVLMCLDIVVTRYWALAGKARAVMAQGRKPPCHQLPGSAHPWRSMLPWRWADWA